MKKRDFILISAILLIALLLFAIFTLTRKDGEYVIVRVDGKEVAQYSLHENSTYILNGGTNVLQIEDGKAWMTEADCPDHVCIKQGEIEKNGETITCLPNKLTVTVYGEKSDVDLVVN